MAQAPWLGIVRGIALFICVLGFNLLGDGMRDYLDPHMKAVEKDPEEVISSRVRYFLASRLLHQSDKHTIKSLQSIQQDHVNIPNSICNHNIEGRDPLDREKTINALVIDLNLREMHIAWGNPSQNSYVTYHLDE